MRFIYLNDATYSVLDNVKYCLVITIRENGETTTIQSIEFATAEDREAARKALKKAYDVY